MFGQLGAPGSAQLTRMAGSSPRPAKAECDISRRYTVNYLTKRFSRSRCGSEAWVGVVEPVWEAAKSKGVTA
jgi:hypothetical protein